MYLFHPINENSKVSLSFLYNYFAFKDIEANSVRFQCAYEEGRIAWGTVRPSLLAGSVQITQTLLLVSEAALVFDSQQEV